MWFTNVSEVDMIEMNCPQALQTAFCFAFLYSCLSVSTPETFPIIPFLM